MDVQPRALALTMCAAVILTLSTSAEGSSENPSGSTGSNYLVPVTLSPDCTRDRLRRSACRLVGDFFRAVNQRDFDRACALLGRRLRSDWQGVSCQASLDGMVLAPVPWGILGARSARRGVSLLLCVGQHELERIWMRKHRVLVAREDGRLRIIASWLVS